MDRPRRILPRQDGKVPVAPRPFFRKDRNFSENSPSINPKEHASVTRRDRSELPGTKTKFGATSTHHSKRSVLYVPHLREDDEGSHAKAPSLLDLLQHVRETMSQASWHGTDLHVVALPESQYANNTASKQGEREREARPPGIDSLAKNSAYQLVPRDRSPSFHREVARVRGRRRTRGPILRPPKIGATNIPMSNLCITSVSPRRDDNQQEGLPCTKYSTDGESQQQAGNARETRGRFATRHHVRLSSHLRKGRHPMFLTRKVLAQHRRIDWDGE